MNSIIYFLEKNSLPYKNIYQQYLFDSDSVLNLSVNFRDAELMREKQRKKEEELAAKKHHKQAAN